MNERYIVVFFSPSRYGIMDTRSKTLVRNPESGRCRLYHSPENAQKVADALNEPGSKAK